jgi:hypothetical protein
MRNILGYRIYYDLRRGWRFNNPNLEQLGLVRIAYQDIEELAADADDVGRRRLSAAGRPPAERQRSLRALFDVMRQGLCIASRYLDRAELDRCDRQLRQPARAVGLHRRRASRAGSLVHHGQSPARRRSPQRRYLVSWQRSPLTLGRAQAAAPGVDAKPHAARINDEHYQELIEALLKAAKTYGLVVAEETEFGMTGYQLNGTAIVWRQATVRVRAAPMTTPSSGASTATSPACSPTPYTACSTSRRASTPPRSSRTTASNAKPASASPSKDRDEWLEKTGKPLEWLPVLFCSPTMELGVDISSLNTVYMRNVPPTPANYAQRSGRAGRAGQPALVITYCASQSPHDQYFFRDPVRMVHGQVNPPTLDLANRELIQSHMHAIWLAETGVKLDNSIRGLLDMNQAEHPPLAEHLRDGDGQADAPQRVPTSVACASSAAARDELTPQRAPWYDEQFAERVFQRAYRLLRQRRSSAGAICSPPPSGRWRSTSGSMNNPAASERERRDAKQRHDEAFRQQIAAAAGIGQRQLGLLHLSLPGQPGLPARLQLPAPAADGLHPGAPRQDRPRELPDAPALPRARRVRPVQPHLSRRQPVPCHRACSPSRATTRSSRGRPAATEVARFCPACGYGHFRSSATPTAACRAARRWPTPTRCRTSTASRTSRPSAPSASPPTRRSDPAGLRDADHHPVRRGRRQAAAVSTEALPTAGPLLHAAIRRGSHRLAHELRLAPAQGKAILGFMINPVTGHWVGGAEESGEADPTHRRTARRRSASFPTSRTAATC